MKKYLNKLILLTLIIVIPSMTGCLKCEPGWKMVRGEQRKGDVNAILKKAKKLENDADTGEKVKELINVYESAVKIKSANRTVLESLARNCFLMGYAYGRDEQEKAHYYIKSMKYSEQALYLNRDYKAKVDNGATLWEALDVLTRDDMYALISWYLSAGSYWKECFNIVEHVLNVIWVKRFKQVITRMMEIDPAYFHGMPYYLWASFYSSAPLFVGGDLQKADAMFKKAIDVGPMMLNYRRNRAYMLYTKTGNREAFVRDMEWVILQDPHKAPLGYPLNVFIQRDAKDGLANVDRYFE